jgi:hypothetical protein
MARLFSGLSSKDGDVPEIARMTRLFSGLSSKDGDVLEIARMARLFSSLWRKLEQREEIAIVQMAVDHCLKKDTLNEYKK